MKSILFNFLFLLAMASFSPSVYSQKIAIIDINDVLSNMPEYKAAQTELDQLSATLETGNCSGI